MDNARSDIDDRAHVQAAIESLSDGLVKTHMMKALADLDAILASQVETESTAPVSDALILRMKSNAIMVKKPSDALITVVHFMMQEAGFIVSPNGSSTDTLYLPPEWDKNSDQGVFLFTYNHPNQSNSQYTLKALFVGRTLAVHVADVENQVYSLDLELNKFLDDTTSTLAGDAIKQAGALRQRITEFLKLFRPSPLKETTPSNLEVPTRGGLLRADYQLPPAPPLGFPNVGGGDAFPFFGGPTGRNPGMEVGPDHPLFGGRFGNNNPGGPVPGARFDPYGPVGPRRPGFQGFQPFPGQQPRGNPPPFGGPDPDHMPMPGHPRNPDIDNMYF